MRKATDATHNQLHKHKTTHTYDILKKSPLWHDVDDKDDRAREVK